MQWSKKNVLVTGGASFIGSFLVEALLKAGSASVRVVDDLSSGRLENLDAVKEDIEFIQGDLNRQQTADRATTGIDVVFHLAADHGGRGYISSHPANCAANMALDHMVFRAAVRNDVEHITFASSACVYPTDIQEGKVLLNEDLVSFSERGGAFADEEYGWAKLMGELSLKAYHKQYGIGAASGRISTAYGPRENETHAIIALIARAYIRQDPFEIWGDGTQTRGFTYVEDVVQGLVRATENISDGSAVNIGADEFISLNDVAEQIFKSCGWRPPCGIKYLLSKPVGVMHRALDLSLAEQLCGWRPRISFEEGVARTAAWYWSKKSSREVSRQLGDLLMRRQVNTEHNIQAA